MTISRGPILGGGGLLLEGGVYRGFTVNVGNQFLAIWAAGMWQYRVKTIKFALFF